MFDPEKLLGGLLRSGVGGRGTSRLLKGGGAMALLGIALEAAEHYMKSTSQPSSSQSPAGGPPPAPHSAPPGPQRPHPAKSVPPPPPRATPGQTFQPDPPDHDQANSPSVLLIRAMIAAAHADGHVDADERRRILKQWQSSGLSIQEQAFLSEELLAPASLEDIVRGVNDRKQAVQVYALSRLVMEVDNEAERQYLERLAQSLNIDAQTVNSIENKLRSAATNGGSPAKGA